MAIKYIQSIICILFYGFQVVNAGDRYVPSTLENFFVDDTIVQGFAKKSYTEKECGIVFKDAAMHTQNFSTNPPVQRDSAENRLNLLELKLQLQDTKIEGQEAKILKLEELITQLTNCATKLEKKYKKLKEKEPVEKTIAKKSSKNGLMQPKQPTLLKKMRDLGKSNPRKKGRARKDMY